MASFTIKTFNYRSNQNSWMVGMDYSIYRYMYFDFTIPETVPGTNNTPVTLAKIIGGQLPGTRFNYTIYSDDSSINAWNNIPFYFTVKARNGTFNNYSPPSVGEAYGKVDFGDLNDSNNPNINFWDQRPSLEKINNHSLVPGDYTLGFYVTVDNYMLRWWTTDPIDLVIEYESYTKCSPPTSITLTPTIQKRDSDVTINWSGAKGGTSNAIAGYGIQYKIGDEPWIDAGQITSSATSDSYSFTIPSTATQGANIRAAVKTIGTVSGYDSDWGYSSTTAGKVNTIPGTPTINFSGQILPSSGGQITLNIVDKGIDPDGQTVFSKYKLNEDGELSSFSAATTLTDPGTYYFYAEDSLGELSYPLIWAVTRNDKPTVSITMTSASYCSSFNGNINEEYTYNPTFTFTPTNNLTNNSKYTCLLQIQEFGQTNWKDKTTLINNSSAKTLALSDVRNQIGVGVNYRIQVIRNDGLENSDPVYCSSEFFKIPVPRGIEKVSNKIGSEDGVSGFEGYFSSGIQPYLYKDTGYNQLEISIDNVYYSRVNLLNGGTNQFYSQIANIPEKDFPRGEQHTFNFSLYNSNTGYKYNLENKDFIRINRKEVTNLIWDGTTNPFTQKEGDIISFLNIFNSGSPDDTIYKKYGFVGAPEYVVKASYSSNSDSKTFEVVDYVDPSTINISLSGNDIYDLYSDLGMNKNSNTVYSTIFSISFENDFGDIYETSIEKKIKWSTFPELTLSNFVVGDLSNPSFVKEGMSIKGTLTIGSYHSDLRDIKIEGIKNGIVFYSTVITPKINLSNPTSQTIVSGNYLLANSSLKIGEQLTDLTGGNIEFRITGTNTLGNSATITKTLSNCNVYRHVPGQINISSASYKNGIITYKFNFSNLGMNDTLKGYSKIAEIKIIAQDSGTAISGVNFDTSPQTKTLSKTLSEQFLKLQIQVTVTSHTNTGKTANPLSKTFYSSEYTLYNSSPTVSYRKNQVGININLSEIDRGNAAFIIGAHSGKSEVVFLGVDGVSTINIDTGAIDGFIIDGGTW